ncbi:MAG: SEL1-like repeat protein [Legionella sp.]|nr:SEL1-like repeat protein [Legionella sp.]
MKSLVQWTYILLAAASPTLFAQDDFHAYRLGQYAKAAAPLLAKTGTSAIADYYLGRMYLYGYGELRTPNVAMRYFNNSAQKGYLPSILLMAKYSLFKDNNPELAARWFKQAATKGDVSAQMYMAAAYLYGVGVKPNEDVAMKYYIDAAKNGNPIAQYTLAEHFIDTKHSGNAKLGVIWLNKSAANGNPKAQTKLGNMAINGKLVSKNIAQGVDLLHKASLQNYTPAMLWLGDYALTQGQHQIALSWYKKAGEMGGKAAFLHLAQAYLKEKSPIYNAQAGYLWTLKAAQSDVPNAKIELSKLYQKGLGVSANADFAKQWAVMAAQDGNKNKPPLESAALWLSNGVTNQLAQTDYQLHGIFSAWHNPSALKDNIYNQAPQIELFKRADIFKPEFALIDPNSVPISTYYDALTSKTAQSELSTWSYPVYPLNKDMEAFQNSKGSKSIAPSLAPLVNTNQTQPYLLSQLPSLPIQREQTPVSDKELFKALYARAILGDAQSQFDIGQMFQQGLGVKQDFKSAIIFYENAAAQQHLGAKYNLGVLYLEHPQDGKSYDVALNWLTDAAFKGNSKAQYVLSHVLSQGKVDENGKYLIKPNREQAISMLYLAAAQGFGLAEYELAATLAQQQDKDLSFELKKQKLSLIRQLYSGASKQGIVQAMIPLAFYNAEQADKASQDTAFAVADAQAKAGNQKAALLLGLLYDRGVGVAQDHSKALEWYKKAGENPVSQFILGTYIADGKGIGKDREAGMAQLKRSADNAFTYAYFNLAALEQQSGKEFLPDLITAYSMGNAHAGIVLADYYLAVNNDLEKIFQAQQIYKGLAEKGDNFAQLKLAYLLNKGLGGKRDVMGAQKWYTSSAEQGNPVAQYLLGQWYQVGENAEPDYALAKEWYQKATTKLSQASIAMGFIDETVYDDYTGALKSYEQAALKGNGKATFDLALMYLYGKGIPVDYKKAKILLADASNKGVHEATHQLAELSFYGQGQPQNEKEALDLYLKAADLGNDSALYHLGVLSETGLGLEFNFKNAIKYYQKASEKGNARALLALARIHHYIKNDASTSANIYKKLAETQNAYAQFRLGTYYIDGVVGEALRDRGQQLIKQASENGNVLASHWLQRLEAQTKPNVSFVESIFVKDFAINAKTAPSMYFEALNSWNQGDEQASHSILHQLYSLYPNYEPAKKMLKKL